MHQLMFRTLPQTILSLLIGALLISSRGAMAQAEGSLPAGLDLVEESIRLSDAGEHEEALRLLRQAVAVHPESGELNRSFLIEVSSFLPGNSDRAVIDEAASAGMRLNEEAFKRLEVDSNAFAMTIELLATAGRRMDLNDLFQQAIAIEPHPVHWIEYAHVLETLNDPRAESAYRAAYELALTRSGEEGDPIHEYARWLLRQDRPQEALALLPAETYADYTLDLLHAVVLEKLGRVQEADGYYALYRKKSGDGALPLDRFYASHQELRIPGSELQRKYHLQFEGFEDGGEGNKLAEDPFTINGLAFMLFGEANLENIGGQRAVAWTAKDRALRGRATRLGDGTFCPAVPTPVDRPNESLLVKYKQVLCQKSSSTKWEFKGMRDRCPKWCNNTSFTFCQKSDENYRVARTVFYGMAPDPVSQRCANGAVLATPDCAGKIACETQVDDSPAGAYFLDGPQSFNSDGSKACGTNRGKVCANGRTDHTFFTNPVWPSKQGGWPTENMYSGMIPEDSDLVSLPVQADGKAYFLVNRKMRMRAHLEHSDIGTDGVALVLEVAPTPDGRWDLAPVLIFSDGADGDVIFDSLSTSAAKPQYFRWDVIGPESMKFKLYLSYTLF